MMTISSCYSVLLITSCCCLRARMMWLTVAEWNPNAIAFYLKYGFERTQVSGSSDGFRGR